MPGPVALPDSLAAPGAGLDPSRQQLPRPMLLPAGGLSVRASDYTLFFGSRARARNRHLCGVHFALRSIRFHHGRRCAHRGACIRRSQRWHRHQPPRRGRRSCTGPGVRAGARLRCAATGGLRRPAASGLLWPRANLLRARLPPLQSARRLGRRTPRAPARMETREASRPSRRLDSGWGSLD